jgi:hypothetical protein
MTATRRRLASRQAAQPVTAVQVMPLHWHYGLLNLVKFVTGSAMIVAAAWLALMMPSWAQDKDTQQAVGAGDDLLFPLMEDRAPARPAAGAKKAPSRGAAQADQAAVFQQGDDEWLLSNPTKESPLSHTSGSRSTPSNRNIQVVVHAQEQKAAPPRRRIIHERGTLTLNRPWAQAENPVNWPGPQPLP